MNSIWILGFDKKKKKGGGGGGGHNCVLISIINAKIVEPIKALRIRAKLSIEDQRPEGKKSIKC